MGLYAYWVTQIVIFENVTVPQDSASILLTLTLSNRKYLLKIIMKELQRQITEYYRK